MSSGDDEIIKVHLPQARGSLIGRLEVSIARHLAVNAMYLHVRLDSGIILELATHISAFHGQASCKVYIVPRFLVPPCCEKET